MSKGGGSVTVGYHYYMNMHFAIAHAGVDELLEIRIGDRTAWRGNLSGADSALINQTNLFGGEKREGGVLGIVDLMPGDRTQPLNPSMKRAVARATGSDDVPAYRGLSTLFFKGFDNVDMTDTPWTDAKKGEVDSTSNLPASLNFKDIIDFVFNVSVWKSLARSSFLWSAMNPYFKTPAFLVRRVWKQWYPEKAQIGENVNPAHIIYECLINKSWGLGYPAQDIDDASFRAAADLLFNEGFGLSMKWTNQTRVQDFIDLVNEHINANLVEDRETGKWRMIMVRDNYNVDNLFELNESNCTLDEFQRKTLGETINEVTVAYTRPEDGETDAVTVQDLANFSNTGQINSQKKEYPGIRDADMAFKIALRDLNTLSKPVAKTTIRCNRDIMGHYPGDVVKINWPRLGLNGVVLRIGKMNLGTLTKGEIQIEAIEDVFGLPQSSYANQQPVGWVDPSQNAEPVTDQKMYELSYQELYTSTRSSDRSDWPENVGFVAVSALAPNTDTQSVALYDDVEGVEVNRGELTPQLTLTQNAGYLDSVLHVDLSAIDPLMMSEGGLAWLDNELVEVASFDITNETLTVNRAVIDTVPARHIAGAKLWLYLSTSNVIDETIRVDGEVVDYRLLTETSIGKLSVTNAPVITYTLNNRQLRPYPAGNVQLDSMFYPEVVNYSGFKITWSHRNRIQQVTTDVIKFDEPDITPEPETFYKFRVLDENGDPIRQSGERELNYFNMVDELSLFNTFELDQTGIFQFLGSLTGATKFSMVGFESGDIFSSISTYSYDGNTQVVDGSRIYVSPAGSSSGFSLAGYVETINYPVYMSERGQCAATNGSTIISASRNSAYNASQTIRAYVLDGYKTQTPVLSNILDLGFYPLCVYYDAPNARFLIFLDNQEFLVSDDNGQSWRTEVPASIPLTSLNTKRGTGIQMFRHNTYYYMMVFDSADGYLREGGAQCMMRTPDLLGTWEVCTGGGMGIPWDDTIWQFLRVHDYCIDDYGNIVVIGDGRKANEEDAKVVCFKSTDGFNFNQVGEFSLPSHDHFDHIEALIGDRLVVSGAQGVIVSEDGGVNWRRTYTQGEVVYLTRKNDRVYGLMDPQKSNNLTLAGRLVQSLDGEAWTDAPMAFNEGDIPDEDVKSSYPNLRMSTSLRVQIETWRRDEQAPEVEGLYLKSWQDHDFEIQRSGYGYNYGNYYGGVV